jgi:hypothetical protein
VAGANVDETVTTFMAEFYGPGATSMAETYRLLHELTDFWVGSWNRVPSRRGPAYWRLYHARYDLTLPVPNLPDPLTLDNRPFFREQFRKLLKRADLAEVDFGRLIDLLMDNIARAERNNFNLQVLLSIARLLAHQVTLLQTLASIEADLDAARNAWDLTQANRAVRHMRSAVGRVRACEADRETRFAQLVATWEQARLPRGMSDGDKHFVHIQDDTKNHTADHTPDLGYLVEAERNLDLAGWADRLEAVIEQFIDRYGTTKPGVEYMED